MQNDDRELKIILENNIRRSNLEDSTAKGRKHDLIPTAFVEARENKTEKKYLKKYQAAINFEAEEEGRLSFKAGDRLYVSEGSEGEWIEAKDENGNIGLIPSDSVVPHEEKEAHGGQLSELEKLPDEILLLIFSHLNPRDILTLQQVNKKFPNLGNDIPLWKLLFQQKFNLEPNETPREALATPPTKKRFLFEAVEAVTENIRGVFKKTL